MARFTIYSKDGKTVRHVGEPHYSGSYMGVDYVEFRLISSDTPIAWEIGDYVEYSRTGLTYRLYSLPQPKKVARRDAYGATFEYANVQFHAATKELEIAPFRDLVTEDNKIHFSTLPEVSTYENLYGIARRIQECMDDLFPDRWKIQVYSTSNSDLLNQFAEYKEYGVSNGSCLDALSQIYDTWKSVGWIHTYDSSEGKDIITIGRANVRDEDNTSEVFAYGKGSGLISLRKATANKDEFATRLYVYGSERNIQTRYYNGLDIHNKDSVDIRNLMLPLSSWGMTDGKPDARKAYLQADDTLIEKFGLIPRTIYFDGNKNEEIYPSIIGLTCAEVRQAMIDAGEGDSVYLPPATTDRIDMVRSAYGWGDGSKEDTEQFPTFTMYIRQVGFDIAEQGRQTAEGYATISMKSGMCAGREFKVRAFRFYKDNNQPELELEKAWDDSIGMAFPNTIYTIAEGDEFVILDTPLPDYYITLASQELLEAGEKMLADYTRVSAFYEPSVDSIQMKDGDKILHAGTYMQVYDEDIIDTEDNTDYVLIDTITIDEKGELPTYKVTLREQKRAARTNAALEDMIEDAKDVARKDNARNRQYTDRRFNSVRETLSLLQAAFSNFSEGINPVIVETMAMLVGDERLQFIFTEGISSDSKADISFEYDSSTGEFTIGSAFIKHMTLGIESISPVHSESEYKRWSVDGTSETLVKENGYYLYAKVSKTDRDGEFELHPLVQADTDSHYYLLVGILNSDYEGKRSFAPMYGYTEVRPGQVVTENIRSSDGKTWLDLLRGILYLNNMAGISGVKDSDKGDRSIAAWFGGLMQDKELDDGATNPARSVIRHDGTGYFADGLFKWDKDNGINLGNGQLKINYDGSVDFGGDIRIGSTGQETLDSLLTLVAKLSDLWRIDDETGELYTERQVVVKNNVIATGEVSAGGAGEVGDDDEGATTGEYKMYHHKQSEALAVWTINHGLGKFPNVKVIDSLKQLCHGDVIYEDENHVTIKFAAAETGDAYLD